MQCESRENSKHEARNSKQPRMTKAQNSKSMFQILNFKCSDLFRFFPVSRGFGVMEAIVGIALLSFFLFGVTEAGKISFRVIDDSSARLQAVFLSEEGAEAMRGIRDAGWAANIAAASPDTDYWLLFDGTKWTLSATMAPFIDGRFDRRIKMFSVYRDSGNDDIVSSGGILDPDARKVTVEISWQVRGATTTASFSTYFTNLFGN